ncbi:hypothetical protein Q4519_21995, partial [Motilimonas sp. 1_MG-2023]|nr:hypothetical protein [Motilimonas sp. 1_MG-2023]
LIGDIDTNTLEFVELLLRFKPGWMTEFADNFFLGVGADLLYASADKLEFVVTGTKVVADGVLPSIVSAGAVLSSIYDSRDYR